MHLNAQAVRTSVNLDSIRIVREAHRDSLRIATKIRKDSLEHVRKIREQAKKEKEKQKKNSKKQNALESFSQTDYTSADSIRDYKRDSTKNSRDAEAEKRKREFAQKQEILLAGRKKKIEPLTQELNSGFRLNSDGWSFFVNRGFLDEEHHQTIFLSFDFSEKKHPKETRTQNDNFSVQYPNEVKPIPYKYGKVNNFYQFKIGLGKSVALTDKLDKKSVVIHWIYNGGLSIGLLKPYYLDLLVPEGNTYVRKYEKYSEENKEYFLDLNNRGTILGGGGFSKGLNEITIKPGIHLKSGFNFDYSTTRKSLLGVEIGAGFEWYGKEIEIMKNTKNASYFLNFYADIRFGKRWE